MEIKKEKWKIENDQNRKICNSIDSKPFISPRLLEMPITHYLLNYHSQSSKSEESKMNVRCTDVKCYNDTVMSNRLIHFLAPLAPFSLSSAINDGK